MDKQKGQREYIKLRLKLANEKLRVAKLLFKNRKYRDAVSRAYYSIFYAAKALLLSQGQDPSSHKGVDTLFHKFCAIHHKPSVDFAKMLSLMRQARLDADYEEKVLITKNDAQEFAARENRRHNSGYYVAKVSEVKSAKFI